MKILKTISATSTTSSHLSLRMRGVEANSTSMLLCGIMSIVTTHIWSDSGLVEGLWPAFTCAKGPASSHGCSMWWHHSRVMQRVNSPLQDILFLLHCKGKYLLWCRWKYVARQTGTSGCARMIHICAQLYQKGVSYVYSKQVTVENFSFAQYCRITNSLHSKSTSLTTGMSNFTVGFTVNGCTTSV